MIKINQQELHKYFPGLVLKIQQNHNMKPIAQELFVKRKPVKGLCHICNYFLAIDEDIYIQYFMEHIVVEPKLYLVARAVVEVTLYDSKQEFENARVADTAKAIEDRNGINLN